MKSSRKLGKEERILWGKVAKTTRPISGRLEDLLAFEDATPASATLARPSRQPVQSFDSIRRAITRGDILFPARYGSAPAVMGHLQS